MEVPAMRGDVVDFFGHWLSAASINFVHLEFVSGTQGQLPGMYC
jgi:hypothetical protein